MLHVTFYTIFALNSPISRKSLV